MPYTQNCSIFAAIGEAGINIAIQDLMAQRPALFNYATGAFLAPNYPLCNPIPAVGDVTKYHNPIFTLIQAPAVGPLAAGSLDFCAQIISLKVDFSPFNSITLPADMAAAVKPQQFALQASIAVGLSCTRPNTAQHLDCFTLTFYAIGAAGLSGPTSAQILSAQLVDLETAGVGPPGLQDALNCLILDLVNANILPAVKLSIQSLTLSLKNQLNTNSPNAVISVFAVPPVAAGPVPNNPALQNDQVQVFVEVQ